MVHLIFTNVTLWIHTLVREITEEYHYATLSETYHSNISGLTKTLTFNIKFNFCLNNQYFYFKFKFVL